MHTSVPEERLPSIIRLQDRCWCDPAVTTLFEPFDVLRWELQSIGRTAFDIRKELRLPDNETSPANASAATHARESGEARKRGFLSLFAPFERRRRQIATAKEPEQSDIEQAEVAETEQDRRRFVVEPHPWEFDMRSYGFPLILDLTWWRRRHRSFAIEQVSRDAKRAPHV